MRATYCVLAACIIASCTCASMISRDLHLQPTIRPSTCKLLATNGVYLQPTPQSALVRRALSVKTSLRLSGGSNREDAEIYLTKQDVPANLPMLNVIFSSDTGSVSIEENDDFDTTDMFLQRQPVVDWERGLGSCTLLMLDPDAPQRKGDGSQAGTMGPWLHWLVTDAVEAPENGKCAVEYMGPAPPRGKHRYIFLLFRQADSARVLVPSLERPKWDLAAFLEQNPNLKPVSYAMFYVDASS